MVSNTWHLALGILGLIFFQFHFFAVIVSLILESPLRMMLYC